MDPKTKTAQRHSDTTKTARPQAPPDNRGQSDYDYFVARPGINLRVRFPFPDEFPICVLLPGAAAFVRIQIEREADGRPKRRARRALRFCEGGNA